MPDPAKIRTRFPPEPNGYLHIGHAKSICLNFGLARDYGGRCHMRFDDTNPVKEDQEYVDGILDSVRWLGFTWEHDGEKNLYFASSYFEYMYQFAEHLVRTGYAYVDEQTADEMRDNRGTLKEPGKNHRIVIARLKKTCGSFVKCVRASMRRAQWCCGRASTWPVPT